MFNFIKSFIAPTPTYEVERLPNGRFAIVFDGEVLSTYSRKRDAFRGAERAGIAVA